MSRPDPSQAAGDFLYLTTTGWRSGRPHEIEIWYVSLGDAYYLIAELYDEAHWVRNLLRDPRVGFRVGGASQTGLARVVDPRAEPALAARVTALFDARYAWSEGLIVELRIA